MLRRLLAVALAALSLGVHAADLVHRPLPTDDYDAVREALVDAIEFEGLVPGPASRFGEMLERTDASLHHGGAVYARAEVFSFCSVAVAAQLVREDPARIGDCPLTMALYRLKDEPGTHLVYRQREGATPGSRAANDLLRRIVERTVKALPAR